MYSLDCASVGGGFYLTRIATDNLCLIFLLLCSFISSPNLSRLFSSPISVEPSAWLWQGNCAAPRILWKLSSFHHLLFLHLIIQYCLYLVLQEEFFKKKNYAPHLRYSDCQIHRLVPYLWIAVWGIIRFWLYVLCSLCCVSLLVLPLVWRLYTSAVWMFWRGLSLLFLFCMITCWTLGCLLIPFLLIMTCCYRHVLSLINRERQREKKERKRKEESLCILHKQAINFCLDISNLI